MLSLIPPFCDSKTTCSWCERAYEKLFLFFCKNAIYADEGGYNSWRDDAYHAGTLGPTKPQGLS